MSDEANPEGGLIVMGNRVSLAVPGGYFHVELDADDMRRFAIALLIAADKLDGVESPPIARLLHDHPEGTA